MTAVVATPPPAVAAEADEFFDLIRAAVGGAGWPVEPALDPERRWVGVYEADDAALGQGWKLHVSAAVPFAGAVLGAALPVLVAERVAFKVAASRQLLGQLNDGSGGASQVGKFVTVYPRDDGQAVRLAVALDAATAGLRGPAIPSDRPLRPGSLVHYRYGGFGERYLQTPVGRIVPAIVAPDGAVVPDRRTGAFEPPAWVVDPFVAAGVAAALPPASPLVGGRYLIVHRLHGSARSAVFLAVDTVEGKGCVLKRARRDATMERDGRDARDRLRHEVAVLERLAGDGRFPRPFGLVESEDELYLAMEDVGGETLEARLGRLLAEGRTLPPTRVVAWGREVAGMLATIHAAGLVYRDLKSTNLIVGEDGRLRLVDFELAYDGATGSLPNSEGTRGYGPPRPSDPPAAVDDVYGAGAILYFLATSAEPSVAPDAARLLDRPVELLNPAIGPALAEVIARCLDPDPAGRYPSATALDEALAAVEAVAAVPSPPFGAAPGGRGSEAEARERSLDLARRLGDSLGAAARPAPFGPGLAWASAHPVGGGVRSRDVNTGSAGAMLALAELVGEFDDPTHRAILREGARWLAEAPGLEGAPLPGLYVGEAGVGAALLRAGQVLDDGALVAAAAERGRRVAAMPHASPDLFNGSAGRLRFHLWLWDETGEPDHLGHAREAGEAVLRAAADAGDGGLRWPFPPGYEGLDGAYLGYAHGAAGIGDALLDLFAATGDERFREAAAGAARWLARQALPALDDGSGLAWPNEESAEPAVAYWCRGAGGIGRFFLHAAGHDLVPGAADLAAGAARTVARGTRALDPTQCHGLAGSIELLLDAFQATGDDGYLAEARSLAHLLEAFAFEREGTLVWPSESPLTVSPDYAVGYAGVAVCLLRLGDPARRPHQLSRRGFRYRPRAGPAGD